MTRTEERKQRVAERAALQAKQVKTYCLAVTRQSGRCAMPAGWGTDHSGEGSCKLHGGAVPSAKKKVLNGQVENMATPLENITPERAMKAVMALAAGQLLYVTNRVAELADEDLFVVGYDPDGNAIKLVPNHWLALQTAKMNETAKYAKMAADAGIAERGAVLQEQQTEAVVQMLERVVAAVDLTPEQRAKLGPVIRRELMSGNVLEGSEAA